MSTSKVSGRTTSGDGTFLLEHGEVARIVCVGTAANPHVEGGGFDHALEIDVVEGEIVKAEIEGDGLAFARREGDVLESFQLAHRLLHAGDGVAQIELHHLGAGDRSFIFDIGGDADLANRLTRSASVLDLYGRIGEAAVGEPPSEGEDRRIG
jgi:hypothetical protein